MSSSLDVDINPGSAAPKRRRRAAMTPANRPIELIDPDSVFARVAGQWTGFLADGCAFVLQAMHPTIGDMVGEYSVYATDPYGRAMRSYDSVLQWVYGGQAAIAEGQRLRRLHQDLQMTDGSGRHISALNPDAYAWVVATAFPAAVWSAPYVLGRAFTDAEQQSVFDDMHRIARILQVPEEKIPTDRPAFWRYYRDMVDHTLVNHPVAQHILGTLTAKPPMPTYLPTAANPRRLPKPVAAALQPAWALVRPAVARPLFLLTFGPLEDEIKDILGISWTGRDQRELEVLSAGIRLGVRVLPERITYAPLAYHARRHHRALHKMKQRELTSFVDHPSTSACPM